MDGDDRRRRAPAQPALPQARPDRPPARGLQVRDDARRQGGHPHRRLAVDLRRGEPRPRPPLARRVATRSPWASAPRSPTTRCSPRASRASRASRAAWCSTPRRACRSTRKLVRGVAEVPVIVVCSRAATRTAVQALEAAGVEVIVATGEQRGARASSHALDELGEREIQSLLLEGGPHLAGVFLEAGEIDEARIFIAPLHARRARRRKTAVEGRASATIADAARAARHRGRADRRRRADHGAAEGVVMFTGLVAGKGGRPRRSARRPASRSRRRSPPSSRQGDSVAVNGVCLTATRARATARSRPT